MQNDLKITRVYVEPGNTTGIMEILCKTSPNFELVDRMEDADIFWFGWYMYNEREAEILKSFSGKFNIIPGLPRRKDQQYRILNQIAEVFDEEISFHPWSFMIPQELKKAEHFFEQTHAKIIAKPADGDYGADIKMITKAEDFESFRDNGEW
jgi:hypothetical protein